MTHEEIQAEISRLKTECQQYNDYINDTLRELPQAKRDDGAALKRMLDWRSAGMPPSGGGNERHLQEVISGYRQKRDEVKAQIEELKAKLRSQPRPPNPDSSRMVGMVKWYNPTKGFGFICVDGQPDVWVPKSSLMESTSLDQGDKVTFKRIQGPKGFKAIDVRYVVDQR